MIEVIGGDYKTDVAILNSKGFRFKGRVHTLISANIAKVDATKNTLATLGGAALGGLIFGGAGAVVGALASGNKGKTLFVVETLEGESFLCRASPAEYAKVAQSVNASLDELEKRQTMLADEGNFVRSGTGSAVLLSALLGPFYFANFGFGAFVLALAATVLTAGLFWLLLFPFPIAAVVMLRKSRRKWLANNKVRLQTLDIDAARKARQAAWQHEHGVAASGTAPQAA